MSTVSVVFSFVSPRRLVLFAVLRRKKWCLLIPALVGVCLASAVAWLLPRKYESHAIIRLERIEIPREQAEGKISAFVSERLRAISYRVLTQEKLLGLIDRFDLYRDRKEEALPNELEGMMRDDIRVALVSMDIVALRQEQAGQAGIVFSVAYSGSTPEIAQRVSEALAALFLDEDIRRREQRWIETQSSMNAALSDAQEKMKAAEEKIVQYRMKHLESMPEHANANLRAMEETGQRIEQAMEEKQTLKERESNLQARLDTLSSNDPLYDPMVKSLKAVRSKMEAMELVIRTLEKKGDTLRRRIEDASDVERGYKALEAERNTLQDEYNRLSQKIAAETNAFELEKSRSGELYSTVEAARFPKQSSSPNIPAILSFGLVVGLAVGVAFAMWRNSKDGALRSLEQAASVLPYPVLAFIPTLGAPGKASQRTIDGISLKGAIFCAISCSLLSRILGWLR